MKSVNQYFYGDSEYVEKLAEDFEFLGRYVKRIPGGIMIPAIQPLAKKRDDGTWGWVFAKPRDEKKKKSAPRPKRRDDEDEEKPKKDRSQRSKTR